MEHFEEKGKKYSLITIRMQEAKTIASVYSLRPTLNATVSMPIEWKKLDSIFPTDFTISSVPETIRKNDHYWQDILSDKQDLRKIISQVDEL